MGLLVDTHAVIWAVDRPSSLTPTATSLLQNPTNRLNISAATIWEIAIKVGIRRSRCRSLTGRGWRRPSPTFG
jgi:PIN domain nuclease of toxin-antitoxin system